MSYFPLDRDILTSSVWAGSPQVVKVWIYLLLAANPRTGFVEDADPAIAMRCGLPLTDVTGALDWLAQPDPHSRSKTRDGRRIERLPKGGIMIVNYLRRKDKDYSTPRVKRWRDRKPNETVKRSGETVKRSETLAGNAGNDEQEQEQEHTERRTEPPSGVAAAPAEPPPTPATPEQARAKALSVLGPKKTGHPTWLTPFGDAWRTRWGEESEPPWGEMAKWFQRPCAELDRDEVEARWRRYLAAKTEAGRARPAWFVQELGQWAERPGGTGPPARAAPHPRAEAKQNAANAGIMGGLAGFKEQEARRDQGGMDRGVEAARGLLPEPTHHGGNGDRPREVLPGGAAAPDGRPVAPRGPDRPARVVPDD